MVHGLPCCVSSETEHRSEPGLTHSTPELPRTSSWSPWLTSSHESHGQCCRVEKITGRQQTQYPHKVMRNRRLRLGSAGALPLYRTTGDWLIFYSPRSAQGQQGRKNSHNGVSEAW